MVEYIDVSSSLPRDTLKLQLNIELPSEHDRKTSQTEFLQLRISKRSHLATDRVRDWCGQDTYRWCSDSQVGEISQPCPPIPGSKESKPYNGSPPQSQDLHSEEEPL